MKKIITLLLCVVMIASNLYVAAADAEGPEQSATYSNYDIITELAYAYDRQGKQIPYDQSYARRSIYSSPEDATAQRTIFLDCSSYVNSCYREAFGVNVMPYEIGATGTSPSTVNFDNYAKENPNAIDVVGYWKPLDYTTDAERAEVVDWIYENLQIGDVLTYRHGVSEGTKGHVYIYLGDLTFIHCGGASSYVMNESNPALSYDRDAGESTIETIHADTIFKNTDKTHKRYIFKATSDDTVYSFGIIRPLARGLTPTQETLNRMKIAGLSMEKTSSVWENSAVSTGDILTYTVALENTNSSALTGVTITDIIPAGTEFVSGDSGVTVTGSSLVWQGDVPKKTTLKVKYSVRVTATTPGTLIASNATYVSGVKLGNITHSVSGYSKTQRAMIADTAIKFANSAKTFDSSLAMANELYKSTFGTDVFSSNTTPKAVLDQLIDVENRTRHTSTELSKMIAPNLYGGYDIRYGWLYLESENDKTRLPMKEHLSVGDIIVADWVYNNKSGNNVYVYAGNKTLVTVEGGVCKTLTIGDNIYTPGENILISLLGYDRYAVLRPTMVNSAPSIDVASIEIATPPSKLTYQSGEEFDSTGMVVKAVMSDGTKREISGYTISPSSLSLAPEYLTIEFGGLTATLPITVEKVITSISEAVTMAAGTVASFEGIVVGVAHEGLNNDTELILKDVSNDTLMAVRDVPYGKFPDFGYKKGDRIRFDATVTKDASPKTCYNLKTFLSFSKENGTIDTTIVSRDNAITYKLNNVVNITSWKDMQDFFKKSQTPYTYIKMSADSYYNPYTGTDTRNYRVHNNAQATEYADIKPDGSIVVAIREDVMNANIGSGWEDILFDNEEVSGYPGTSIEKEFYAVYIGGNGSYYQLAILDESWIYALDAPDGPDVPDEPDEPDVPQTITSVSTASAMAVGSVVKVEGVVVGAGKESPNDNEEMYIKDLTSDAIIAVRDIPSSYGTYPTYGYERGDRIMFTATIKQETSNDYADVSPWEPYCAKKFLSFSTDKNGTKASTIISKNYNVTYNFDNVTTLSTWAQMQNFFDHSRMKAYTYVKITGDLYMHLYNAGDGSKNFRIHKNPDAAKSADIQITSAPVVIRDDMMEMCVGEDWMNLLDEGLAQDTTSYPGTKVTGKSFYAVACGGKRNNNQLVILDESWIYDADFYISEPSTDGKTVSVNIPEAGTYSVAFADYEGDKLAGVKIVPVTVAANKLGLTTVNIDASVTLSSGDKIMLFNGLSELKPMCECKQISN